MQKISGHKLLVAGESYEHCLNQVVRFFDQTTLVMYDHIEPIRTSSFSADMDEFSNVLQGALDTNRRIVSKLVSELEASGCKLISELGEIQQGYQSKTLHILSHFLDGFVGIDSYFYNLLEDSHWVSPPLTEAIEQEKEKYWIIHIDCFSATPEEATLLHMGRRKQSQNTT